MIAEPEGPHGHTANAERNRLIEDRANHVPWKRWGPYLSDRQWGTVREDYSAQGDAWGSFPHDHARSRTYRWGEDGLLGICDSQQQLCFALTLWNGADPILKERLFGLTGHEGNHGEDVKEAYFYLDNTPTHSYMKALYKYPQGAFPYDDLLQENRRRGRSDPEYELVDTGAFAENRYFDVQMEYAKANPTDLLIRISATNRGPDPATIHLLPTLWFRNTWSWGLDDRRPELSALTAGPGTCIHARHHALGDYLLALEDAPELLFTENETNTERLWGNPNRTPYVKDGFGEALIRGNMGAVNPNRVGTKSAAHYRLQLATGATRTVTLRLSSEQVPNPFAQAEQVLGQRQAEADSFYRHHFGSAQRTADQQLVQRQAFAGLLWSKQFYLYDVREWLDGDPDGPQPPSQRLEGRNAKWRHLNTADLFSMPDTWEYPWFAAWDLAFHTIPMAQVDPAFAKHQLILLLREWYMHPNGQLPAYEWAFGHVNPPVHAWAAWRVYKIDRRVSGKPDRPFLERMFHKLLINFTWWVNRKDADGRNVFQGGFLGLDNIGLFDRSAPLPTGGYLDQADGTAWMGMYCLTMLAMALELARENRAYEDVATKFFEHFLLIAGAMNNLGGTGTPLWNEEDGFFYDVLRLPTGEIQPLKARSIVGLIPLLAVETIEPDLLARLPGFSARMDWFLQHRPDLAGLVSRWSEPGAGERRLLALVRGHRMKRLLSRMLDPKEFLGDYGVRSLSRFHAEHPYTLESRGTSFGVDYEPGESTSALFGGNSNWRGPVWFPINFLLIEALQKFHHYYGDDFLIECPHGSGQFVTLWQAASELSGRLTSIFLRDAAGRRPVFGDVPLFQADPDWRDHLLFYEHFHGETGRGLGASHQTGWTALVAKLVEQTATQPTAPARPPSDPVSTTPAGDTTTRGPPDGSSERAL